MVTEPNEDFSQPVADARARIRARLAEIGSAGGREHEAEVVSRHVPGLASDGRYLRFKRGDQELRRKIKTGRADKRPSHYDMFVVEGTYQVEHHEVTVEILGEPDKEYPAVTRIVARPGHQILAEDVAKLRRLAITAACRPIELVGGCYRPTNGTPDEGLVNSVVKLAHSASVKPKNVEAYRAVLAAIKEAPKREQTLYARRALDKLGIRGPQGEPLGFGANDPDGAVRQWVRSAKKYAAELDALGTPNDGRAVAIDRVDHSG